MANYLTTDTELTAIANSIRIKGGTSAALTYPTDFITAIEAIETTPETQTKTISPNETVQTVEPDEGKLLSAVTVTAISSNYIGSNITQLNATTYIPSASTQTIAAGVYLAGAQTIEPIPISVENHRLILPDGLITV